MPDLARFLLWFPLNWFLAAATLLALSRLKLGVVLQGARTAFKVTLTYAVLSFLGGMVLLIPLAFLPDMIRRLVAFVIVGIPSLYLCEALVTGFEVDDLKSAARAAVLISVVQTLFWMLLA